MSINMITNVRWKIVLNATGVEWHTLQHGIGSHMADEFIYSINRGGFKFFTTLCDGENSFDIWARRDDNADVEFAALPTPRKVDE